MLQLQKCMIEYRQYDQFCKYKSLENQRGSLRLKKTGNIRHKTVFERHRDHGMPNGRT